MSSRGSSIGTVSLALGLTRARADHSLRRRAAADVRLEHQLGAAAEAHAIDLQVLQDALDVVAGLGERNALDPVDRIDARVARVAVALDPFLHPAGAGVVAREGEDVGAAIP